MMFVPEFLFRYRAQASGRITVIRRFLAIVMGFNLLASSGNAQVHDHEAVASVTKQDHSQHAGTPDPNTGQVIETTDISASQNHSQHPPAIDSHTGSEVDTGVQTRNVALSAHNHGDMTMNMSTSEVSQVRRRDPHAYSNGLQVGRGPYALDNYRLHLADETRFSVLTMNRMEQVIVDGADQFTYDGLAWYGTNYNRLVLKAEGEVQSGSVEESNTEFLWTYGISRFWNTQVGLLHQTGGGVTRNWLALGMIGTAPYWFEIDATFYLGDNGRTAFNIEAEYDLLLNQRTVLQPRLEMNLYGKDDQAAGVGSGLSDISAGLRLQHQINRQFVPYIGVEQARLYGQTARFSGIPSGESETRWLAGLSFWF